MSNRIMHKTDFSKLLQAFPVLLFSFLILVFVSPARADLFTVENVQVDVTAESAAAAREQAFEDAQSDAFTTLAKRMLPEVQAESFQTPPIEVISSLIKDFEVSNEKLSNVRYMASYTFRFQEEGVRRFFVGQDVDFTDVSSEPILILPFYQTSKVTTLWSPLNPWMNAWQRAGNQSGLVPLIVPIGDLEDVSDIKDHQMFEYSQSNLNRILKRYGAGEAALLIAEPDQALEDFVDEKSPAQGRLSLHIYRTDQNEPVYVKNLQFDVAGTESVSQLYGRAVSDMQKLFMKNWKAKTTIKSRRAERYKIKAHFSSLQEWATIQRTLNGIYGVETLEVENLNPQGANLKLHFSGPLERLQLLIAQNNMSLVQEEVDPTSYAGYIANAIPSFSLYLNSSLREPLDVEPYQPSQFAPAAGGPALSPYIPTSQRLEDPAPETGGVPQSGPRPYIQRF